MIDPTNPGPSSTDAESLPRAIAAHARRASDAALFGSAALGLLGAIGLAAWRPAWWAAALALLALGAYGLWGVLERERLAQRHLDPASASGPRAVVLGQWLAVAVGVVAAFILAVRAVGAIVGTVIS